MELLQHRVGRSGFKALWVGAAGREKSGGGGWGWGWGCGSELPSRACGSRLPRLPCGSGLPSKSAMWVRTSIGDNDVIVKDRERAHGKRP